MSKEPGALHDPLPAATSSGRGFTVWHSDIGAIVEADIAKDEWAAYRAEADQRYGHAGSLRMSTAAGICTGSAAQKCTTGSVVACPRSPWEGPARGATRPRRGWRRPARGRGLWAHGVKRGVIRTVAGVVTGSA